MASHDGLLMTSTRSSSLIRSRSPSGLAGEVYRHIGEYEKALGDFDRAEAIDPEGWEKDIVLGLLDQADTHARLGNEAAALACCARLPDDFWTPGMNNTPSGGKAEIAEKIRQIAADARRRKRV